MPARKATPAARSKSARKGTSAKRPPRGAPERSAKGTKRSTKAARPAKPRPAGATSSQSSLVDAKIREVGGWRGETLARVRALIREADPQVVEEIKWRKASNPSGVPVWSHAGGICTGESYKDVVKLTFFQGAALQDPRRLFNAASAGGTRRAIDLREGGSLDEAAFKALVREALELNEATAKRR